MSKKATSTEEAYAVDRQYGRCRNVAVNFLHETKAIDLDTDLTELLIRIDNQHQQEPERLTTIVNSYALASNKEEFDE